MLILNLLYLLFFLQHAALLKGRVCVCVCNRAKMTYPITDWSLHS